MGVQDLGRLVVEAAGTPVLGASDHGVTHSLQVTDPDGNEVELYVDADVGGNDWRSDPTLATAPVRPLRR